jgi:hypothetical protein
MYGKVEEAISNTVAIIYLRHISGIPFLHELYSKSIGNNANKPLLGGRSIGMS